MSKADYFKAAVNDDAEALQSLIKFANTLDSRKSSNADKIIHGFGAIHYAALLGRLNALKFLLPHELTLKTTDLATFRSPHYSKSAFYVALYQDCLHLAIAKGQWASVDQILLYVYEKEGAGTPQNASGDKYVEGQAEEASGSRAPGRDLPFSESRDVTGLSHLELICKFPASAEVLTLLENQQLLKEFKYREKKFNCLQIAAYNGRPKTIEKFIYMSKSDYKMRRELFMMVTSVAAFGETVFDFLKKDINYELNETSKEERDQCREWILQILPNAFVYLESNEQLKKHLDKFNKHYKKEGTVYYGYYDFDSYAQAMDDGGLIINEDFFLPEGCKGRLII